MRSCAGRHGRVERCLPARHHHLHHRWTCWRWCCLAAEQSSHSYSPPSTPPAIDFTRTGMLAFALAVTTHRWRGSADCCRTLVSATATLRQMPSCSQPSRCSSRFESSTGRESTSGSRRGVMSAPFQESTSVEQDLCDSLASHPPSRGRRWSRIPTGGPGCAAPRSSRRSRLGERVARLHREGARRRAHYQRLAWYIFLVS
jgi:hypothetical protein